MRDRVAMTCVTYNRSFINFSYRISYIVGVNQARDSRWWSRKVPVKSINDGAPTPRIYWRSSRQSLLQVGSRPSTKLTEETDAVWIVFDFRDSLHSHEKELERTSHNIKELIKEVKNLINTAKNLSKAQRTFGEKSDSLPRRGTGSEALLREKT